MKITSSPNHSKKHETYKKLVPNNYINQKNYHNFEKSSPFFWREQEGHASTTL
jgi:hypothetical protein